MFQTSTAEQVAHQTAHVVDTIITTEPASPDAPETFAENAAVRAAAADQQEETAAASAALEDEGCHRSGPKWAEVGRK